MVLGVLKNIQSNLSRIAARNERVMLFAVRDWFEFTTKQIQRDLTTKYAKSVTSELTDWDGINAQGIEQIKPATLKIMQSSGNVAYKQLALSGSFSVLNVQAVKAADKICAELVKNVTNKTKAGIRTYVSAGIREGKSMPKIAKELRPLVGLTKPQTQSIINYRELLNDKEKYPKLSATDIDRKVQRYTDKTHRRRMNTIARTESARAQNVGYCEGLMENGVTEVEFSSSQSACDECLALENTKYPVEEAQGIIPVHPNCRCAMLPVVGESTVAEPGKYAPEDLPATMQAPEGLPGWKKYNKLHPEQSSQESLYDWYKLKYESDGKLSPSAARFLKANAKRFEAKSVKIGRTIPGVQPTPVSPADLRAVKPTPKVLPKPKGMTQARWEKTIVGDTKTAFDIFTESYEGYFVLRDYQLGKTISSYYVKYAKLMDKALKKAPKYKGTVYRGSGIKNHTAINDYYPGSKVKFNATTSSSKLDSVAREFMGYADDMDDIPVKFSIKTNTGVDISKISMIDDQAEVVLAKGSEYRVVTNPEWIKAANYKEGGYYLVRLEQIAKVPKIKPPGILPKSYFNAPSRGFEERLATHTADLKKRMGFDFKDLKVARTDLPEYKAAVAKFEKALKSYTKPTKNLDDSRKYLQVDAPNKNHTKRFTGYHDDFAKVIEDIGCDDAIELYNRQIYVDVAQHNIRANAKTKTMEVFFTQTDTKKVAFHELGHLLSHNEVTRARAGKWLARRGGGFDKKQQYSKIVSWSKDPEMAYKDKFIDPYVGKIYPDGDTEVLSMGLQQFTNYNQMMRFAKKDFDHFSLIHGILTGAI